MFCDVLSEVSPIVFVSQNLKGTPIALPQMRLTQIFPTWCPVVFRHLNVAVGNSVAY